MKLIVPLMCLSLLVLVHLEGAKAVVVKNEKDVKGLDVKQKMWEKD